MVEDREEVVTVAVGVGVVETALDIKMMDIEGITETVVIGEEADVYRSVHNLHSTLEEKELMVYN